LSYSSTVAKEPVDHGRGFDQPPLPHSFLSSHYRIRSEPASAGSTSLSIDRRQAHPSDPRILRGQGADLTLMLVSIRAQAFSWLHDAAWMGGWWRYRAADRCDGCGCDLAAVLGGLVLVVNRGCVTGHAGKRQARR
jgi:hypothetical protein